MRLEHTCSLEWMKARQKYLTASDVKALLPVTATGRPRKIGDKEYLKVWASKKAVLTEDDCVSTGAAARGHILEPFAIKRFNMEYGSDLLSHWDDIVVYGKKPGLTVQPAFSPDAVDVAMPKGLLQIHEMSIGPGTVIGEVKCYSHERHVLTGFSDPAEVEERWQIAHAMYTSPCVKKGWLILYDPSMGNTQMFCHCYSRSDLMNEIRTVEEVVQNYNDFIGSRLLLGVTPFERYSGYIDEEQEIMKKYFEMRKLNP